MSDGLRYVKIDKDFNDIDRVAALYDAAFPAEERFFTVSEVIQHLDDFGFLDVVAVYDGDDMVGFYAVVTNKELHYKYLHFIAVNTAIRSKGYGSRILSKLLEENKDEVFFGSIEKPLPDSDNYEMKVKRQQFYEKNGMITVDRERLVNGVCFIIVTNKTGEEFDRCYENEMAEEKRQINAALKGHLYSENLWVRNS